MNIAIGADHRGFLHKEHLTQKIHNVTWIDVGAYTKKRSDYPVFARAVVQALLDKKSDLGVLICGSGVGMAILANRFAGIFAGVSWNDDIARMSKEDDNTNILVIPSNFVTAVQAEQMLKVWLKAKFKEGIYQSRIDMIDAVK